MKVINFIAPQETQDGFHKLIDAVSRDLDYKQTKEWLAGLHYYLPEDQFEAVKVLFNSQMNMEIGHRRKERK